MTKNEAVIISAYTGYLLTDNFSDVHAFCEKLLGRPIFTHEFADSKLQAEIQEKTKPLVLEIIDNLVDTECIDELKHDSLCKTET